MCVLSLAHAAALVHGPLDLPLLLQAHASNPLQASLPALTRMQSCHVRAWVAVVAFPL